MKPEDIGIDVGDAKGVIEWAFRFEHDSAGLALMALRALEAAGYVVVPKEPTEEMLTAGWDESVVGTRDGEDVRPVWNAMLEAAPRPWAEEKTDG